MTDPIDEFWLPMQNDFKQKKFKSITRGDAELSKIKPLSGEETPEQKQEEKDSTDHLIARMKEILSLEVKDVTLSERLVDSPVCLVAPENDMDINMQRLLKKNQAYDGMHQPILEINAKHPVIARLQLLAANDGAASQELLRETTLLLLDQARIIEGEPLKNPADFVRRLSRAIEKGLMAS